MIRAHSFIRSLFNDALNESRLYSVNFLDDSNELESMWKEAAVAKLKHCPGICCRDWKDLERTVRIVGAPCRDSKHAPSEYMSEALRLQATLMPVCWQNQ
jgi:hypothetical protein